MAAFTMYLSEVIASLYGETEDLDDYEIDYDSFTFAGNTWGRLPKLPEYNTIGLGYYPIFDTAYRGVLNGLIIDEYWNQEIGVETIDLFVMTLRKKMDQIMPYYNDLYRTQTLEFDPLKSIDIHTVNVSQMEGTEEAQSTNESETQTDAGARAVNSNFPQTALAADADYATSATDTNSDSDVVASSTQNTNAQSNTTNNSDSTVTGYQGNISNLLQAYRNVLININMMILDEIKDCFMMVHDSGDEYFASESRYGVY